MKIKLIVCIALFFQSMYSFSQVDAVDVESSALFYCGKGADGFAVRYFVKNGSIPTDVPLWVDGEVIACLDIGRFSHKGRILTTSEVNDLVEEDRLTNS